MHFKNKKIITTLLISLLLIVSGFITISPVLALEFPNPLNIPEEGGIYGFWANIIKAVLGLVGSLSLVFFVWGGMIWMTAGGNEEKIKKGKDTLIWSVLGLIAIFASYAILSAVISVLSDSTYGNSLNPNLPVRQVYELSAMLIY